MQGKTLGAYRILREIGRGGMGTVYVAEHTLLGREAAVKVLLPELSTNHAIVTRFFNEARAAAAIRHMGIVEVYDFGFADEGPAFIAMELLSGESLSKRLTRGRLAPVTALGVARQIAGPLAAAHKAGIVHRDLKPDNIFIVADDEAAGGERVKLLDFGVAKLFGELGGREQTHSGAIVGTPNYMAPEQCRGVAVDHRADLYSLGCILFRLLTGVAPFRGEGSGDVMFAHVYEPAPSPSAIQPGLDPAIDALVLRLLAKRPEDRLQRAEEVVQAIDACLATLHAPAPPLPAPAEVSMIAPGPPLGTITSASHAFAVPVLPRRTRPMVIAGVIAAVIGAAVAVIAMRYRAPDDDRLAQPASAPVIDATFAPVAAIEVVPAAAIDAEVVAEVAPAMALDAASADEIDMNDAAAPEAGTIAIAIDSRPPGARVLFDGVDVGATPLDTSWPAGERPITVSLKLDGYRVERVKLVPSAPLERTFTLRPAAVRPPNPFE